MPPADLIAVVDYNPAWPQQFVEEAERLASVLDTELVAIHHIGSTAIHYMPAKPIIDVLSVVRSIANIDALNADMEAIGYAAKGEYGLPGRRYFTRNQHGARTHHVHIWESGHPEIARHLNFRDYLMSHGDDAERYAELKLKLAKRFPRDAESYNDGKSAFIRKIEQRALWWRQSQRFGLT